MKKIDNIILFGCSVVEIMFIRHPIIIIIILRLGSCFASSS